jgi:hypothetical protein
VYGARELAEVRWHPFRKRTSNYALHTYGYHPMTTEGMRKRNGQGARPGHRLFYLMACGHRSLPGVSVCERGCLTAPEYPQDKTVRFPHLEKRVKYLNEHDGVPKPEWRLDRWPKMRR